MSAGDVEPTSAPKCHTTWHEGFDTCEAYKNRESGDTELRKWMGEDRKNRKNCPKCSAPIEKISGCQHMTCSQCKSHICWQCLKFFQTPKDCDDHLIKYHSGVFGPNFGV